MRGPFSAALACVLALAACGGATQREHREGQIIRPAEHSSEGGQPSPDSPVPGPTTNPTPDLDLPGSAGAPAEPTPTCQCLEVEIGWWVEGGPAPRAIEAHLAPCATISVGRGEPDTCVGELADCIEAFNINEVNAALQHPDLQAALAQAPVVYGRDQRDIGGQVDHIEIDGKVIEVGDDCDGASPCEIPPGVHELEHLLGRIGARQSANCPLL
jgi:hypothetical protein